MTKMTMRLGTMRMNPAANWKNKGEAPSPFRMWAGSVGLRKVRIEAANTSFHDNTQVKIYAWYDNEWGYVNRLMDIVEMVAEKL